MRGRRGLSETGPGGSELGRKLRAQFPRPQFEPPRPRHVNGRGARGERCHQDDGPDERALSAPGRRRLGPRLSLDEPLVRMRCPGWLSPRHGRERSSLHHRPLASGGGGRRIEDGARLRRPGIWPGPRLRDVRQGGKALRLRGCRLVSGPGKDGARRREFDERRLRGGRPLLHAGCRRAPLLARSIVSSIHRLDGRRDGAFGPLHEREEGLQLQHVSQAPPRTVAVRDLVVPGSLALHDPLLERGDVLERVQLTTPIAQVPRPRLLGSLPHGLRAARRGSSIRTRGAARSRDMEVCGGDRRLAQIPWLDGHRHHQRLLLHQEDVAAVRASNRQAVGPDLFITEHVLGPASLAADVHGSGEVSPRR